MEKWLSLPSGEIAEWRNRRVVSPPVGESAVVLGFGIALAIAGLI